MDYLLSKNDLHSEARPNITIHKPTSKTAKRALHTSCRRRSVSMREGPPRTTVRQARARQGVSRGRGPPDMEADHARHGTGVSAGAPISAFSWSTQGLFDANRVNSYAASHREEALSTICARVKNANLATPYRSLAFSRRKPDLQGTSRFRQDAVQLRSRKPTLLRNRRSSQPQGQRQARPFACKEFESAKNHLKPQGSSFRESA